MEKIGEVFISHTHADAEIAHALSEAIGGVFGDLLTTSYSTKKELDGGIKPGEEWFRWIVERVRAADIAVILLTPGSTQKPWVLWEAGAVYGAGIASADASARKVRPLVFKLSGSQVPSPFAGIQGVNGDERSGIERFLDDLILDFRSHMNADQVFNAGRRLGQTIDRYVSRVQIALRDAPLLPTEAAVQEWCERLDKLVEDNRLSEVGHLHDWLNLTFGRGRDERPLPLDLRLHRRLGNAYRASKRLVPPDREPHQLELVLDHFGGGHVFGCVAGWRPSSWGLFGPVCRGSVARPVPLEPLGTSPRVSRLSTDDRALRAVVLDTGRRTSSPLPAAVGFSKESPLNRLLQCDRVFRLPWSVRVPRPRRGFDES